MNNVACAVLCGAFVIYAPVLEAEDDMETRFMVFEKLKEIFGTKTPSSEEDSQTSVPVAPRIFRGRADVSTPDFAANVAPAQLVEACNQNLACNFVCHINRHRIYGERGDDTGDSSATYQGITASCSATQYFGEAIAAEDGFRGAYKYVDLNHIFECCCGQPDKCRFYNKAVREKHGLA